MTFNLAITTCLRKYATFFGRASRSEYWWFVLFQFLVNVATVLIGYVAFPDDASLAELPGNLVALALLLPGLAVGARRLHDVGRSGWWQLLYMTGIGIILLLVWFIQKSQQHPNRHGGLP